MSSSSTAIQALSLIQNHIIKTVLYFDVFRYPLLREEVFENSPVLHAREEFNTALSSLLSQGLLVECEGFICAPFTDHQAIIKRRRAGNKGAEEIMPTARQYSRRIASFPFVEGVYLSGALSKKYFDDKGDIDYFIVTAPGRLWICRTLLILRYKLLPKSKKKFWCTNYFVSSDHLFIEDRNPFTGTELAHLLPVINYELYQQLLRHNLWSQERFPNKPPQSAEHCADTPCPFAKKVSEYLLGGLIGAWLDDALLKVTLRHWQRKYPEMSKADFELQFRSRKNVCKRHTTGYQNKVLEAWQSKQKEYAEGTGICLNGSAG